MICWPATQEMDHKVLQAGDPESRKCGQATQGTNHKVLHACLVDITECGPATQGTAHSNAGPALLAMGVRCIPHSIPATHEYHTVQE